MEQVDPSSWANAPAEPHALLGGPLPAWLSTLILSAALAHCPSVEDPESAHWAMGGT